MFLLLAIAMLIYQPSGPDTDGPCPITLDCSEWDFGDVDWNDGTLFHTFKLTNTSDEDFRLGGLTTSCSCVSAYIGRIYIKAGESIDLKVSVKAGGYGKKEYYVVIFDSKEKMIHRITLKLKAK